MKSCKPSLKAWRRRAAELSNMSPTNRLLACASAWLLLAAAAVLCPPLVLGWKWLGGAAAVCVPADGVWVLSMRSIQVRRKLPGRFALGEAGEVGLILRQDGRRPALIELFDGIPQGAVTEMLPWSGEVPPNREIRVFHRVKLMARGEAVFGPVQIRRVSPLGFWLRKTAHLPPEIVRVYPNYEPVIRFALLAMQNSRSQTT